MEGFFYTERDAITRKTAEAVLERVFAEFGPIGSAIDVGCGVGTWLSIARRFGAERVLGIEGPQLGDTSVLKISTDELRIFDLAGEWRIGEQYDLGICLEVGEHLPEQSSRRLVENLAAACKLVLFSAGVPGQGGFGHINEQWPIYWQDM